VHLISVEHLTKYYGDVLAVDDLSFEIAEGHVYGFLGPNGAGKSTTMNIMTGCLSATDGRVLIDGYDIFEQPKEAKRRIGYLPEQPPVYLNDTPLEYLRFVGQAKGLRGAELESQIGSVMEMTGITGVRGRRIGALSKGYRQRVGIAQALLGQPQAIILDEPTVGLDPIQIIEIRDLIRQLGQTHTVIISSHILSEVQSVCDRVLMIDRGRLVAFDSPEELQRRLVAPDELLVRCDADVECAETILGALPAVSSLSFEEAAGSPLTVHVRTESGDIDDLARDIFFAFAARGTALYELSPKKGTLEDVFLELTESESEAAPPADSGADAGPEPAETENGKEAGRDDSDTEA